MNILFLGNFESLYSSENDYKKALIGLGHSVIAVQEGKVTYQTMLQILDGKIDYFFWVHTHGWDTPGIEHVLNKCRSYNIESFAYHLDLYMGIQRQVQLHSDPFFQVDHFFTVDPQMSRWLNDNTRCIGHFVPAGVSEEWNFMGRPNSLLYPHEIIFTGSTNYHPEWPYRVKLVNWLKETYGDRFAHYGGGGRSTIRGVELNNLYASAKIVIGDTLCRDFNYSYYSSDRLFEVIGRGGFLIYPKIKGLDDFFSDMDDVVYYPFDDFTALKYFIDHFLENDKEREIIRNRGFWRVKREHTYTKRLSDILLCLEGSIKL